MNRRVVVVLVLTFVALVAATVWVPVEQVAVGKPTGKPFLRCNHYEEPGRTWVWAIADGPIRLPESGIRIRLGTELVFPGVKQVWRIRWGRWALAQSLIIAIGGLFALFVRTRAARRAA